MDLAKSTEATFADGVFSNTEYSIILAPSIYSLLFVDLQSKQPKVIGNERGPCSTGKYRGIMLLWPIAVRVYGKANGNSSLTSLTSQLYCDDMAIYTRRLLLQAPPAGVVEKC